MNEADTCRTLVVPKLQAAGWEIEPHSIAEQRTITDGRIVPAGKGFIRRPPKRVDYLLRYTRDFPLAVIASSGPGVPLDGRFDRVVSSRGTEQGEPGVAAQARGSAAHCAPTKNPRE